MRLFVTLGLVMLAAAPVAASPFDTSSFRDAKSGYRVNVAHTGETMLLDGYNPQTHARFHLTVSASGVVHGVYEGRPVDMVVGSPAGEQVAAN